jgi:hypothetical protein
MRISSLSVVTVFLVALSSLAFGQDTNFNKGPQYLLTGSPMLARSIATPAYSLAGPPLETGADNATAGLHAGAENQYEPAPNPDAQPSINLFPIFYGRPAVSVVEVSFSPEAPSKPIPNSILNAGVEQIGDWATLQERGYGITLAEAASLSKKTAHATRVYANADLERLHPNI